MTVTAIEHQSTKVVSTSRDPHLSAPSSGETIVGRGGDFEFDRILRQIARGICELLGVRRSSLFLADGRPGIFRGAIGHWDVDIDADVQRLVTDTEFDAFTREIVTLKAPVAITNVPTDPRPIRAAMRQWSVQSILGVPLVDHNEVIGILYADDVDRPRIFGPQDKNAALSFAVMAAMAVRQGQAVVESRERLAAADDRHTLLRQCEAVQERLSTLLLEGGSVCEILRSVAKLSGRTLSLHDPTGRLIVEASPPGVDDHGPPRIMDNEVRTHPAIAGRLSELTPMSPAIVGPVKVAGFHQRSLVVSVDVLGQPWGIIVAREQHSRLTRADALIVRRAAIAVATVVTGEQRALAAHDDAISALVLGLIAGDRDITTLERRAESVGIQLDRTWVVATITARDGSKNSLPTVSSLAQELRRHYSDRRQILGATVPDGLVLLLELEPCDEPISELASRLAMALGLRPERNLVAGVSARSSGVAAVSKAFQESLQTLGCLRRFASPDISVLTADALGPMRLFLASAQVDEVDAFVTAALAGLLEPQHQSLLATLDRFLDHGLNARRAAEDLGLHENTVRYRLQRIEALVGQSLCTDPCARLNAHLALLISKLRGATPQSREAWSQGSGPSSGGSQ